MANERLEHTPLGTHLSLASGDPDDYRFWADILAFLLRLVTFGCVAQGGDLRGGIWREYVSKWRCFKPGDGHLAEIARESGIAAVELGKDRLGLSPKAFSVLKDELVRWRNWYTGHPTTQRLDAHSSKEASEWAKAIADRLLDHFPWIWTHDWLYTNQVTGKPGAWAIRVAVFAGSEPLLDQLLAETPPHLQRVILLSPDRHHYLVLDPFLRWEECPRCGTPQLFAFRECEVASGKVEWADRAHRVSKDGQTLEPDFGWKPMAVEPSVDVLFVCTGATCRSPMAASICREVLSSSHPHLRVAASGLQFDPSGVVPHALRAVPACKDVERRQLDRWTLRSAKLVLVMEPRQLQACRKLLGPGEAERAQLLTGMAGRGKVPVPDPYNGTEQDYHNTAKELRELLEAAKHQIAERLRS